MENVVFVRLVAEMRVIAPVWLAAQKEEKT